MPKHSKQVLLEFSGVLKLPDPEHFEQISLRQGLNFSERNLGLQTIFESSIFKFEIREIIRTSNYKIKRLY